MGNSEVGHLTIGAGAVDYQDLVRINKAVADGSICKQPAWVDAFAAAKSPVTVVFFCAKSLNGSTFRSAFTRRIGTHEGK